MEVEFDVRRLLDTTEWHGVTLRQSDFVLVLC